MLWILVIGLLFTSNVCISQVDQSSEFGFKQFKVLMNLNEIDPDYIYKSEFDNTIRDIEDKIIETYWVRDKQQSIGGKNVTGVSLEFIDKLLMRIVVYIEDFTHDELGRFTAILATRFGPADDHYAGMVEQNEQGYLKTRVGGSWNINHKFTLKYTYSGALKDYLSEDISGIRGFKYNTNELTYEVANFKDRIDKKKDAYRRKGAKDF